MKKSLYIRICNKALGFFFLLIPYLYSATSLAGTSSLKTDFESTKPANLAVSKNTSAVILFNPAFGNPDTSKLSFEGSSQYSLYNLLKKKSNQNYIPGKAMAAPPTIVCPGNITTNTDPGFCTASKSGVGATINDPDGDITTLTWTMTGTTIAASPISGINNISGAYLFNKGITAVTYRVTDAGGSTNSCSFTVTVTDNQIPLITCPLNQTLTIPSCATITDPISFSLLSVSDNCGILNFSSNAPAQYPLGNTFVLWTANDISGNSAQCTQTVTVINEPAMNLTGSSTPISCFGGNDGTASVSITGGSPPYTYSWSTVPAQTTSTATNLLPGTYTVAVTDFYGCTGTTSVTVSQPAASLTVAVASQFNATCFGSSTGSITVAGNGGTPAYQYSIDGVNFQAGATFPNLAAGTYTITVRDSKNCVNTTTATLTQPATAVTGIISSQTNVSCLGTATGSVTVAGNGGLPPYQYNINGGTFQASGTFGSLIAGAYTIIVRDVNNCTSSVPVTIIQSATAFSASITGKTNVICAGQSNGTATVTATGGTTPYTYSWNTVPVQTTATAINLAAQNYTVTAIDAFGCRVTATVTIGQPAPLVVAISQTNVACFSDSTGTATALASGGTPPYTYAWLTVPIQTTATVSNLPAGTYTVAVFDSLGCFRPAFVTITQPATKLIASITNIVNVACAGNNTGSIIVTGSGGVAPIQYNINGGTFQASGTFNGLGAGVYNIIARDANNCTVTIPATITAPASPLSATISSQTNVLCSGQANGSATVTATGGTSPYTYSWNSTPVQTAAVAINLTARNYTVTVTDAAGCTSTANVTITQPAPLIVNVTKTDISCFGDSTGTATALASGGTPPYTYAWLTVPIQTTATVTNLPAGTYTVAVFDSLGCFRPAFVTITQPATKLIASVTSVINVACAGINTGSITVTGSGGVAPIQYNINGGAFQASGAFTNLAGGVYTIIARDANNCIVNLSATITAPLSPLTATISSQTNVLCSGQANGSASVTVNGGTLPYTYSWNSVPVQTTAVAINLPARSYTVTVTDAAGCISTANVTITQPTPLIVTIFKTDVSCFGDSTGTATALASGGTPPYTYAWLTVPIQTTATVSNLPAGTYTVAIFDSLGCFKPAFVTITQPATKLIASISNQVNVLCTGGNTGLITVAGSGGIAPIEYNINGGAFQASGTFNNLIAGTYTITVRDANNCTFIVPATITEPANALTAIITDQINVLCSGGSTGSATVTASGGTSPYTYSWNTVPVQTSPTATNLSTGNYTVTVTDAAGCIVPVSVTITEPAPLVVAVSKTDVLCFGGSTGTATALASGGTPPYTYAWMTTPVQTTATASNLPAGTYTVAVFDSLGCFKPAFISITEPATALTASISDLVNVTCGGNTGSLTVSGSGGIPPYQYKINSGAFQTSGVFDSLSAGVYTITALDANNCTFDLSATITEPANALKASIASQTNVLCPGQATGIATVAATDGTAPYTYSWNTVPVQTTATITSLAAGSYIVTTTDFAGCVVRDTAFITEPPTLTVTITNQVNFDCATGTNGSVTVAGTGGTPGYQYSIDGGPYQAGGTFADLAVGNYIITVQDTNNCEAPFNVEIIVSGLIQAANDTYITAEDTPLNDNVMNNDQVACNLPIIVTSNTSPLNGLVSVNPDGTFTYSPALNYNGTDSFTYTITDNVGGTSTATVFITIDPVNDPPVTLNDSVIVNYNLATSGNLLLNGHYDPDGTPITVTTTPVLDPVNGTFVVAADGSFTYTPDLNFIGNDIVIVSMCDAGIPLPQACSSDTIFIVVLPANLPPVTINENIAACQDGSFTGSLTNSGTIFNGDTDPENNLPLTLNSILVQDAAHGSFTITDAVTGTFDYTPNNGYTGSDFVIVSICDSGIPVECSNDTIFIEVQEQAVVFAGADTTMCAGATIILNQASALNISTLLWIVAPDTAGIISDPSALNPTFTPANGFSGTAILTLSAKGNGACSDAEVFDGMNIIVNGSLIADAGDDQTIVPGTATILSGSVSGGSGFYAWNWRPSELLLNPSDEDPITIALNATTTFTLTVFDIITGCTDDDSVEITVDDINTLVAVADHDTTLINASGTFDVLDNDQNPDNDPLTVSICGYPAHGLVIINSDNTITYTPYSDYEGDDEFCYRICSNVNPSLCSEATVFVNVKQPGLNDLFAYSGLSPNDDGINDVWKVRGIEKYPDNTVIIFNRWGDILREFAGYNNTTKAWDGKNENGDHLPDGTYFYILDVKDIGELKGWIYIRGSK